MCPTMKKDNINSPHNGQPVSQVPKGNGDTDKIIDEVTSSDYKYGFVTDIASDSAPMGK